MESSCIIQLGVGSALECDQPTRDHIIKENWLPLSPRLSNASTSSGIGGILCLFSILYAWILSGCNLNSSCACCHNCCEFRDVTMCGFRFMEWALNPTRNWLATPLVLMFLLYQLREWCCPRGSNYLRSISNKAVPTDKSDLTIYHLGFSSQLCQVDNWSYLECHITVNWSPLKKPHLCWGSSRLALAS